LHLSITFEEEANEKAREQKNFLVLSFAIALKPLIPKKDWIDLLLFKK